MEHLNLFIAQIAVIFVPGIVWARLDTRFGVKEKSSEVDFFIRTFIYGLASYGITFVLYSLLNRSFVMVDFQSAQDKTVLTPEIGFEILAATAVGFLSGIAWVAVSNHKLLSRFLQKLAVTKRYGDEDVWDYTFNSPVPAVEYVHVRDFSQKLVFAGWVLTFSETGKLRELVIRDAQVFDFDGDMQYEVPMLYLARKPEDVHVEFPQR